MRVRVRVRVRFRVRGERWGWGRRARLVILMRPGSLLQSLLLARLTVD